MEQALLIWLVLYASLYAVGGFVAVILRSFLQRGWSNRAVLRGSMVFAFFASSAIWLLTVAGG